MKGRDPETSFLTSDSDPPAKRRILIEALRLFGEKGLCETTIRDIAAATGYTNPALYKHFRSKEELALQLFIVCYRELFARVEAVLVTHTGFEGRLRAYLTTVARAFDERPEAVMYVTENLHRFWPQVSPSMRKRTMITQVRELVRLAAQGHGKPHPVPEEIRVATVVGTINQVSRMIYLGGLRGPASRWVPHLEGLLAASLR